MRSARAFARLEGLPSSADHAHPYTVAVPRKVYRGRTVPEIVVTVQEMLPYLLGLNTLASLGAVVYAWLSSSGKEALTSLEKLDNDASMARSALSARCGMLEQSVAVLQSTVDHLPSSDTTHRLEIAVARVEGRIETLTERLQPIAAIASRLQEQAMEGPRR